MLDYTDKVSFDATNHTLDKHIDGELVFLSHDNLNFLAEQHNTSTLESPNPKYEDVGNGDVDGTDIFLRLQILRDNFVNLFLTM